MVHLCTRGEGESNLYGYRIVFNLNVERAFKHPWLTCTEPCPRVFRGVGDLTIKGGGGYTS